MYPTLAISNLGGRVVYGKYLPFKKGSDEDLELE